MVLGQLGYKEVGRNSTGEEEDEEAENEQELFASLVETLQKQADKLLIAVDRMSHKDNLDLSEIHYHGKNSAERRRSHHDLNE